MVVSPQYATERHCSRLAADPTLKLVTLGRADPGQKGEPPRRHLPVREIVLIVVAGGVAVLAWRYPNVVVPLTVGIAAYPTLDLILRN